MLARAECAASRPAWPRVLGSRIRALRDGRQWVCNFASWWWLWWHNGQGLILSLALPPNMEGHKLIVGETILVDCKRFFPSHPSGNFPVFFLFFFPLKWAWSWSNEEAQLKWSSTVAVAFLPPGFSPPSPSLPSEIVIVLFVLPTHTIRAARHAPCQRLKPSVWCQLETPKPNSVIYSTSNLSDSTSSESGRLTWFHQRSRSKESNSFCHKLKFSGWAALRQRTSQRR